MQKWFYEIGFGDINREKEPWDTQYHEIQDFILYALTANNYFQLKDIKVI